jgi:SAM-dependent methyltransferase
MTEMSLVSCDLCGGSKHSLVYECPDTTLDNAQMYRVVACDDCGLGFINPQPAAADMGDLYFDHYYDGFATAIFEARMNAQAAYLPAASSFTAPPRLLDVGCGDGSFGRHMAALGWQAVGVEPYCPIPIDDFPVHRRLLTELDASVGTFDAVTAWAVLEHVPRPSDYFHKIAELLRPGGTFVFLVTNFDSLSSKRLYQEDVPRHCTYFTKRTVERYLGQIGMELVAARFDDDVYPMGSRGALNYFYCRYLLGRRYERTDYPASYPAFLEQTGLPRGAASAARFVLTHPISALDRLAEPLVERWLKLTGNYGIVTYTARKPG